VSRSKTKGGRQKKAVMICRGKNTPTGRGAERGGWENTLIIEAEWGKKGRGNEDQGEGNETQKGVRHRRRRGRKRRTGEGECGPVEDRKDPQG